MRSDTRAVFTTRHPRREADPQSHGTPPEFAGLPKRWNVGRGCSPIRKDHSCPTALSSGPAGPASLSQWAAPSLRSRSPRRPPRRVDLGTAEPFSVLAGSTVTNTGADDRCRASSGFTRLASVTGAPVVLGDDPPRRRRGPAGQERPRPRRTSTRPACPSPRSAGAELAGQALTTGVYTLADAAALGRRDSSSTPRAIPTRCSSSRSAVDLTIMARHARSALINGAQPCNVYWQVGTSARSAPARASSAR